MDFDCDNGCGRWIAGSEWDTYAHANRYSDGYRHSYRCTNSDGYSYCHGYRCADGYSDTHNSTHTDPKSYCYAGANANASCWSSSSLQL